MANNKDDFEQMMNAVRRKRKIRDKEMSREIARIYSKAFIDSYKELEHLLILQEEGVNIDKKLIAAKIDYTRQIDKELGNIMEKYMDLQTEDYINAYMDFFDSVLPQYKHDDVLNSIKGRAQITNRRLIDIMNKGGIYKDNMGLSDRLWFAADASGNKLNDAIMSCIAQGKGAADIAQAIEKFGKGNYGIWSKDDIEFYLGKQYANKYSGGLSYPAMRLARTTLTHLHQLQVIKSNEFNPYVGAVKWHSVHSVAKYNHNGKQIGGTCSQCIEREKADDYNMGPGIYPLNSVPFDHPNGMCYLESVFGYKKGNKFITMTPEDIGDDIGKWIRGEKNSGTMDKIPDYKNLPIVNTNNKSVKEKPKEKAKKTTTKKEKPINEEDVRFKDYLAHFNNLLAQSAKPEARQYVSDVTDVLKTKFPKSMQEGYLNMFDRVLKWTQDNGGAYWNPGTQRLQINIRRVLQQARDTGRGMYDVWFHETGHAMDSELAKLVFKTSKSYATTPWKRVKPLSSKNSFINALYKDLENQRLMIKKKYLAKAGENLADYTDEMIHEILPDSELQSIYYDLLAHNNKTAGIQDVLEGLTNCKIRVRWGHGKEYWNRNNRNEEVASEAWANFLGSYSDDETNALMKEYFPEAMKEQEKIIKDAVKKIEKAKKEANK